MNSNQKLNQACAEVGVHPALAREDLGKEIAALDAMDAPLSEYLDLISENY